MIKKIRKEHPGFTEWKKIRYSVGLENVASQMFQRWQYFYTKGKKQMDCVEFTSRLYDGMDFEIYGSLIEDVERFSTLAEAEKRIEELYGDKIE